MSVNPFEMLGKLQELMMQGEAAHKRYEAYLSLYQAASLNNDVKLMDEYRQQLHVQLDITLDIMASCAVLQRTMRSS